MGDRGSVFAVKPFLGDITRFVKPARHFRSYVASLGRSFTVVKRSSRPAFRVSSVVILSVLTKVISIHQGSFHVNSTDGFHAPSPILLKFGTLVEIV